MTDEESAALWATYRAWQDMTAAERRAFWEAGVAADPHRSWAVTDLGRMAMTVSRHVFYPDGMLAVRGEVFSDDNGGEVRRAMVGVRDRPPDSYFGVAAKALAVLMDAGHVTEPREDGR